MIHESWFDILTTAGLRKHHLWLQNLPTRVERIANFGCWSGSEPFALLWTLDAKEVMVIEIEEKFIQESREQMGIVTTRHPKSLQDRTVNYVCGNMTETLPQLPGGYFDLAYCENVLYTLPDQGSLAALERGILQMIRVVKPGGFIVAVEPKFGVEFKTRRVLGVNMATQIHITEPKDMSDLFASKGLGALQILGSPAYTYCYQKSND